jgi:hypothetical protein
VTNGDPSTGNLDPDELRAMWAGGRALDAGRLLFESVPPAEQPAWAARLVVLCRRLAPRVAPVENVLAIAADPARWDEAHAAFRAVRARTVRFERPGAPPRPIALGVLFLAELTAKVTYNASAPIGPFDEDSGWWLAVNLRSIVEQVADAGFEERAWRALADHLPPVT